MQQILLVLHVLVALVLVGLVLIQHGKGADSGAAFGGGASATVFGSQGATPFLVKLTAALALVFFSSCLYLSYDASHQNSALDHMKQEAGKVPQPVLPMQSSGSKHGQE